MRTKVGNMSVSPRRWRIAHVTRSTIVISGKKTSEDDTIRQRLHDKYVTTGEWMNMSADEKEDAALAETMLYTQEQPDYHVYSPSESKQYRTQLREKLKVNAGHR